MATVNFTPNLRRHVNCPTTQADGETVAEVLGKVFAAEPLLRGYVLDEQGALRKHMVIFLDGIALKDRICLSDPIPRSDSEIFVMQALSGG
ncbi:MAG: MoaD/ThiS family protein [Gammaproteobacteria bacterium]|nr:MoaD/ThiS family protein [Gammaproteobacteria bacterium]